MSHDPASGAPRQTSAWSRRAAPFRVGVISDTHVPKRARTIPEWVFEAFEGVDLILHAGDLTTLEVLDELARLAPVEAVAGNMDLMGVGDSAALPRRRVVDAAGVRIGLIHGDDGPGRSTPERARLAFKADPYGVTPGAAARGSGRPGTVVGPRVIVFGHSHQPFNEVVDGVLMFNPGSATDARTAGEPSVGILTVRKDHDPPVDGEIIHRPRKLW